VSLWLGLLGATLAFFTPFVTLSFLVTTPEAWVPAIGDAQHGFPFLSGAGRLVIKDVMLLAGSLLVMADSARGIRLFYRKSLRVPELNVATELALCRNRD
jgi:reactive chlorine resistance protein C